MLDAFSAQCFDGSMNLWPITPQNVATDLDLIKPDLLFVESAWSGNQKAWRYQLTSSTGPKKAIRQLLDACNQRGIPTVFWNKEDPPHFEDFLPLASMFDHVLTTEGDMVPRYRAEAGRDSVGVMQFAASPLIHNPFRTDSFRQGAVCFAGQYFQHKYPERQQQMDMLFPPAKEAGLTIYSRMLQGASEYQFPVAYSDNVVGSLPYDEMVHEYKRHKIFLNVNSVPQSATMCARRIFELSACKTVVISADSPAIRRTYPDGEVLTVTSQDEAADAMSLVLRDDVYRRAIGQRAWRRTAAEHLYQDRVMQIASLVGQPQDRQPSLLRVFLDAKEEQLGALLDAVKRQSITERLPVVLEVLLARGTATTSSASEITARTGLRVRVLDTEPLAPTLAPDALAAMSGGTDYGPDYLLDLFLMLDRFPVGDVVSKARWTDVGTSDREERLDPGTDSGAWIARGAAATMLLQHQQDPAHDSSAVFPIPSYVADPFNLRRSGDSAPSDWTC
ncbi:CgeB family protein [Agrococcus carbonis]|uniref:CgeB family protein n=1 Tax=Agrococcus carbonis TaxID=684552 RepID=UPI000B0613AD|nr:glycosyltransferase [Agrococcus carbonis]